MDNSLLKETISLSNRNMCRLCLSTNGVTEPIGYGDQFLLQKIYECTSIQITPLAGVSSALCTICRARLEDFYQFRWQCIKNDEILHRIAAGGSNKPLESGEGRIQSDNSVDCNKRLQESASIYSTNHSRAAGLVHHTEAKSHHHGVHSVGMPANDAYSPFGSKYTDPAQACPPVSETAVNFRRKRGRPPKQQYDFGPNVISKGQTPMIGEQSQSLQRVPENRWNNVPVATGNVSQMDQDTSGSSSENQEEQEWFKVKVEQIDQQTYPLGSDQLQHMPPMSHNTHHMDASRAQADCAPSTQLNQVLASPTDSRIQAPFVQTGVKRSRGRPPREGGCPNEDRAEYRFRCQYCSARFKAAINLKLHTNTHTGEKPYLCTVCNKSFAHPSNLSVHMKLHSNQQAGVEGLYRSTLKDNGEKSGPSPQPEKRFQCPYCQTNFALAFQLKIHINTHTGQKPYVCKNCGKGFAQPSNLHVHSKKHCRRKQVPFGDTRPNEGQSSESYTHTVPENTVTMQTVESNRGGELSFGRSSSYQAQDSSHSSSHHLNNTLEENHRNNHPAMNSNHPMLV
ncbi:zinc finger protein 556-like [Anopheles ziemanni]|uniref:zinc finger protein 556-like n=1 Tax=Anopheles coustani TaxID=139045 RepID=UPI00265A414A|nr:zinc finger protein 556-like [Anopheles coustani]XP_058170785.1 zinc finger protein 556-like [Anopheles ziemanni]